jgi:sodium/hydrogen antiporter
VSSKNSPTLASHPIPSDGLSIPFFKLGGRVHSITMSRTLSLRGNHEPEWAGQTVKVTRPEDIVINRDPVPQPGTTLERDMEEGRAGATTLNGSDTTGKANGEEGAIPADDNVIVREWREGRHLVREYHPKAPGEEVSSIYNLCIKLWL